MKSIWNGSISFGLVNIPVKLYSAIENKSVKMRLLHKDKLSPIRYKKWCDKCKKEVDWKDIVKGIEVEKNQFIILTKEELEAIKPEKTQRIEIIEVVDSNQIDFIYFNSHYYLGPEKSKDKTYFLFKEVLQKTAKIAIGRIVMHEKEYVVAIESYKQGLLLTTLNYSYEIRDINEIPELSERPKISVQELNLANQLIEKIYQKEPNLEEFKDTFSKDIQEIIKKKGKGEKITISKKEIKRTTEDNLVEALKMSLK